MQNLKNQRAIVTGGSRGLGLGVVEVPGGARGQGYGGGARCPAPGRGRAPTRRHRRHRRCRRPGAGRLAAAANFDPRCWCSTLVPGRQWGRCTSRPGRVSATPGTATSRPASTGSRRRSACRLARGSRVLISSSGAAIGGSPLSGGYAGAKRMLWFMADYANAVAAELDLGIRFQALVPQQMTGRRRLSAAPAPRRTRGARASPPKPLLADFGKPMSAREFGEHVVNILTDPQYEDGAGLRLKGDYGIRGAGSLSGVSGQMPSIAVQHEGRRRFLELVADLRPELHRYCARMTGSVADGEDIVQETLARAYYVLPEMETMPALRPWLFRIAHNRALDHLRRYEVRMGEPLETVQDSAQTRRPIRTMPSRTRRRCAPRCRASSSWHRRRAAA